MIYEYGFSLKFNYEKHLLLLLMQIMIYSNFLPQHSVWL